MPDSIDDHVEGVKPLPYRLAETLNQSSLITGAYRDGAPAEKIQADDTQLRIYMPQGCLFFTRKPTLIGLLQFRQGEQPRDGKPAEWFLSVYGKSNERILCQIGDALGKAYGVTIKADVFSEKQ